MVTKQKKQKKEETRKQVFPDQLSFDIYIRKTRDLLSGIDVHDEDIEAIIKEQTEKYGQNLPEEAAWILDERHGF
mgnify:FL=1